MLMRGLLTLAPRSSLQLNHSSDSALAVLAEAVITMFGRSSFSTAVTKRPASTGLGSKPSAPCARAMVGCPVPHSAIVNTIRRRNARVDRIRLIKATPEMGWFKFTITRSNCNWLSRS